MNDSQQEYPQLREELEIVLQQTVDGDVYLVRDSRSGRFCRFRETEYQIATLCNGERSPAEICERVSAELQGNLSLESLESFLAKLDDLGLLESSGTAAPDQQARRISGGLLHRRMRLFDPDRLLRRLLGPLGFLFTGWFLVVSTMFLLAAGLVALINREALGHDLVGLVRFELLLPGLLAFAFVALIHEFSHGLTCRRFGGSVRDMGFLLIYFMPAFYCDVSSAWGFPRKSHRLWVTFAGVWCNLLLWAGSVFLWRATQADSGIHTAALLLMGLTGLDTFFNLVPLIKLDGYYLLSDALEAANLRQNSFAYLGGRIKRFFGGPVSGQEPPVRLRRIYTVYGMAASVFSTSLLIVVSFKLGGFLMSRFQAFGFVAFVGLLALILVRPLSAVLRAPLALAAAPLRIFGGQAWIVRMTLFVGTPVVGAMMCPWRLSVVGDVEIIAAAESDIRARTDGLIAEMLVAEGDEVCVGQPVARLLNSARSAELQQVEADIDRQTARLELRQAGESPEKIAVVEAAVASARTRLEHARRQLDEARAMHAERVHIARAEIHESETALELASTEFERFVSLRDRNAITTSEFDRKRSELESAQAELDATFARERLLAVDQAAALAADVAMAEADLEKAESELALLQAGPRDEEVRVLRAEIDRLVAQRDHMLALSEQEVVRSPLAGIVTTPDLHELLDRPVQQGDLVATVQRFETVRVEMSVSERELGDLQIGRPVDLKVLAYPDRCFSGEVVGIAPAATPDESGTSTSRRFVVTTLVNNESGLLQPGMTGKSKIRCGDSRVCDVIVRKLKQSVSVEFWSWW